VLSPGQLKQTTNLKNMKFSLSWLKDFIDINVPVEEVCIMLTSVGIEVGSITKRHIPPGVKAAKVLSVEKHPNADKLSVCLVDAGEGSPLAIVCGAPNVKAGMLAALATIGTKFDNGFTITKAKLRGIESSGMLCSEKELGISDDHSGIMTLPNDITVGCELSSFFPDDAIIEIELTPNRGDCLSLLGVAREVAAKLKSLRKNTSLTPQESGAGSISDFISVSIEAAVECPRYGGRLVKGVRIAPSPKWMAQRLTDAGVRPINNVVDITNYIMLHFGQPMHAFDYAGIEKKKIIVRKAGATTKFTTLDSAQRDLVASDLLICDGEKPVALAGIMGGAGSEISDATTDVFLECAYFDPPGIRKTSKRLGLSTESSYRFERGVDPEDTLLWALDTAAEMLRLYANGTVVPGRIDVCAATAIKPHIRLRPSRVNTILGVTIPKDRIVETLSFLGIACRDCSEDEIECLIPAFRHDISLEIDLIEEAGRFYGYDNIGSAEHALVSLTKQQSSVESRIDTIRSSLAFLGLNEIVTNSLTSGKKNLLLMPCAAPVALLNPLSPDMAQLRTTLLGSTLEVLAYNINRKNADNRYFEIGRTYTANSGVDLPHERDVLAILISGKFFSKSWNNNSGVDSDFYLLKGILDKLSTDINSGRFVYTSLSGDRQYFDTQSCSVTCPNGISGAMGKIKEQMCTAFAIKEPTLYAELDITNFLQLPFSVPGFCQLPKYPALERDFCFVVKESLFSAEITDEIRSLSPLVENVTPFDVYRGDKLGQGLKSIAFSVQVRSAERTLTDREAEELCGRIVAVMEKKYGATLRK
jgi:phenylalanyl-tRNA synthetase beta chain